VPVSAEQEVALDREMANADAAGRTKTQADAAQGEKSKKRPVKPKSAQARFIERRSREIFDSMPMARVKRLGSALFLVAVIVVIGTAFLGRNMVVAAFPDLASLYKLVGIEINVVGLDLTEVRTISTLQNGNRVLVVDGRITSTVGRTVEVPPIRVSLIGANGAEIYNWRVRAEDSELEPGDSITFETQLAAPPQNAVTVRLSFDTMGFAPNDNGGSPIKKSVLEE